jgi:uncharacterized membrane protein
MSYLKTFVTSLVTLGIFDFIWLGNLSGDLYTKTIQNIQGSPLAIKMAPALIAYLLMALAITLVIEQNIAVSDNSALTAGFFIGLIVYGIFNGTNAAILNEWTTRVSIIDTLWGISLFSTATFLVFRLKSLYP